MKRYLLWTFRCLRGRRCADMQVSDASFPMPGVTIIMDYSCGGCGTHYSRSALLGNDGAYTQSEREIVRA